LATEAKCQRFNSRLYQSGKTKLKVKWAIFLTHVSIKNLDLIPGVNFINVLRTHFSYKILHQKLQSFVLALRLFGAKILYEKYARKMLMKLTAGKDLK